MQIEKFYSFICVLFISALTVLEPSTAFSRTKEQKITLPNHDKIIFTASGSTVTVLSPEGKSLLTINGLYWEKAPGKSLIFCHKLKYGHDLFFSFYGTGGSNGAIQVLALDTANQSARIVINSLYRPLAFNRKTLELAFGDVDKFFYGRFSWNNNKKKIILSKKYLFSCHLKPDYFGAQMYNKLSVCTELANKRTQKNWEWFY
ncbi:hypothetical protein ACSDBR_07175 [Acidithiobacillus ferriphilus]|uniref:hypothetical protein n=1 Tax=Acidithiobacillus ferriphilus TaxID=1689834 RepID=UPI003F50F63B